MVITPPWHLEYESDTWITGGERSSLITPTDFEHSSKPSLVNHHWWHVRRWSIQQFFPLWTKKGENNALTQSNINKTYENHLMSTGQQHSVGRFKRSSFCKRDFVFRKIYVEYPFWSFPREEQEKIISIYTTALQSKTSTKKNHSKLGNMLITLEDKYPPKLG